MTLERSDLKNCLTFIPNSSDSEISMHGDFGAYLDHWSEVVDYVGPAGIAIGRRGREDAGVWCDPRASLLPQSFITISSGISGWRASG